MEWMALIKWMNLGHKDVNGEDYLVNPKTEIILLKKNAMLAYSISVILTCIIFPLYLVPDKLLPQFFFGLVHHIKYETFFERYLHLIDQGGIAFADRFFIAYGLVLTTNVVVLIIIIPVCYILLRRNMVPLKRATKKIKWCFVRNILILLAYVFYIWNHGYSLNQLGFFRANERYIIIMLVVGGTALPGINLFFITAIMKFFLTAYDTWRDGTFREVFLSKN